MLRPAVALSALVLATAGASGCGGDDPDRLATGDDFSVEAALAELHLPDLEEGTSLGITVIDLAAASEFNGVPRPDAEADLTTVQEWWDELAPRPSGDEPGGPIPIRPLDVIGLGTARPEDVREELGIPAAAIGAVAQVQAPPHAFAVVQGDLDEGDLAASELTEDDDGTFTAGSGDELEPDPDEATNVRRTGAPLRVAADGDRIAVSATQAELDAWREGEGRSLAEQDDVRDVAAALDGDDVVAALILTDDFGRPAGAPADAPELEAATAELLPIGEAFTAAGVGFAADGDESLITVAYAFADGGAADTAVDQVEAVYTEAASLRTRIPIADELELDEVEADGSVVIARLRVIDGPIDLVAQMLTSHDTPFLHR